MKRTALCLTALLLLLGTANAADYVKWSRSLEEAMAEAADRGSLIFIAMVINDEADNEAQQEAYKDPGFIKATRDFVCLFCNPMTNKGEVEMEIDGEKMTCSRAAPGIRVRDHAKAWNDVQKNYAELNTNSAGDTKIPFHLVIDPKGKVLGTIVNGTKEGGFGAVPAAQLQAGLRAFIAQHGKGLTKGEYEELKAKLAEGTELLEAGDLKGALKRFRAVVEANDRSKLADLARERMKAVSAKSAAALETAEALIEKDLISAVLAFEEIAATYAGTETGDQASKRLAELKKRPDVKAAFEELEARKEAEAAFTKADEAVTAKKYTKALGILDGLAEKFEGTEIGEKAKAAAQALRDDEEVAQHILEQEAARYCKGWISMGKSFAQNGMADKAREQFEKVIERFPGTKYAAEAKRELAKLR